ncbi:MAG: penicillin-binding transpeptidase domain-containing protein [Bacillota bacterium]|nr:penicillin-binding transpeptidase domain-containing protein [Bacillota bacterium]
MARDKFAGSVRKRMFFFIEIFLLAVLVLCGRLFYLQLIRGSELKSMALEQQTKEKEITPKRGTIFDRNGKELAVSATVDTVVADPTVIKSARNAEDISNTLSSILGMDKADILKIINRNSSFEWVAKKIDSEKAKTIRMYINGKDDKGNKLSAEKMKGHNLGGISLVEDSKRFYPGGSLASHVIGFTGSDNQGLEGIEAVYDKFLKGNAGKIVTSSMSKGSLPSDYEKYYNAQDGDNVVLTLDSNIQYFVEKALDNAYIEYKALGGACVIVTNPNTGEVLAMATRPTFDLNNPRVLSKDQTTAPTLEQLQERWRNKVVVDAYEPGSVFKLVTCSIALEEKVTNLTDGYFCPGYLIVGGRKIHCFKTTGHGASNLLKGTVDSCNPVYMQVAAKIGKDRMYKYFKSFGFRETTDFDLPGEAIGSFWNYNDYNEVELATSSFGQGFTVTPLQMATAIGAIVNGGYLYKPYVVKEIVDQQGNAVQSTSPKRIRQVISKDTSDTMRYIMQTTLVESGSIAKVDGYDIGGKSGTSEKLPRGNGQYIGSYCSVAPINDPKVLCLVIIDDPRGASFYGGQTAAPVASSIMEQILQYYNIPPKYADGSGNKDDTVVPDVTGKFTEDAQKLITSFSLKYSAKGSGKTVVSQEPAAGTHVRNNSYVTINLGDVSEASKTVKVPNAIGKSVEEVNSIIADTGLKLNAAGTTKGEKVISLNQSPPEGTEVARGSSVTVNFAAQ